MKTFELRFTHLHLQGRAVTFPCDEIGRVDVSAMREVTQISYQRTRLAVGDDFAEPFIRPVLPVAYKELK